jgi:hypothetical protein
MANISTFKHSHNSNIILFFLYVVYKRQDSSGRLQDWDLATGLWGLKVRGKSGESLLKLHQAAGRESVQKKQLGHIGNAIRDLVGKKRDNQQRSYRPSQMLVLIPRCWM